MKLKLIFYLIIIYLWINIYIYIPKKNNSKTRIFMLKKGRDYLNICIEYKNILTSYYFFKKPKISVIIPIYNCQDSIKYTISSIQNQKMKDYEIIMVNDCSKDKSKEIIDNYSKKDGRIIIINNNKNMGTLYSRNIGVLSARGKFIFALDNDDLLFNRKIFWELYKEGINNNFDIIGFKTIYGKNYNSSINYMFDEPFILNKKSKIVFQPELKFLSIKNKDIHIWGKLIKKEIYVKAINLIGIKRYSVYLCITEDDIMVFMLYNSAKSYKYLPIYGLFHLVSKKTTSFTLPKNHIFFANIFYSEIIFDFTKNDYYEKNFIIKFALNLLKRINKHKKLSNNNRLYLKRVVIKMMNYNYINNELKLFIRKNFKEFV